MVGGFTKDFATGKSGANESTNQSTNAPSFQSAFSLFQSTACGVFYTGFADSINPFPAPTDYNQSTSYNNSIHFSKTGLNPD